MKIQGIELYNCQRLRNKGITRLKLAFTEMAQVILGRNGSGKSTLLRELSPLPPANEDYAKGGYKRITIEHKGCDYTLLSHTGSPSRHSFIKDGVELNASKTMNAQKVLCKEHFDYTPEIHELILGLVGGVSFTTMSTAERREWFMALYPNDLSFVNELHEVLKTLLRDTKGGMRINSKHLTELLQQQKEGSSAEVQQRIHENQRKREQIARLVKEHIDTTDYQRKLTQSESWLRDTVNNVKTPLQLVGEYTSRDDILAQQQQFEREAFGLKTQYDHYNQLLNELKHSDTFKQLEGHHDKAQLQQKQHELRQQLEQYQQQLNHADQHYRDQPVWCYLSQLDDLEALRGFLYQYAEFCQIVMAIPEQNDTTITRQQYQAVEKLKTTLDRQLFQLNEQRHQTHHKLQHYEKAERTRCPSCHYQWVMGVSDQEIQQLQQAQQQQDSEFQQLTDRLAKASAYLDAHGTWYQAVNVYYHYIGSRERCQVIYSWLEDQGMLHLQSKYFASLLPGVCDALMLRDKLATTQQELHHTDNTLSLLDGDALAYFQEQYTKYEQSLTSVIDQQRKCKTVLARIADDLIRYDQHQTLAQQLSQVKQDIQNDIGKWGEQMVAQQANQLYRSLVKQHENDTALLYGMKSLEGSIQSTERLMGELDASRGMLDKLVTASSPVKGLVAEQLSDFIRCFVGNMNAEIEEVWLDTLTITPCNMEEGSLSFRFPVISGEDMTPSKDVSTTSTGETQIINWVYRMIVMRYLGLSHYPLHLDEVGANFDEAHRIKMMGYVKKLVESGEYSQVFMVSHYFAQHGSMINAEVCALTTDGVALPEKYNEHVEMD